MNRGMKLLWENTLSYKRSIDKHNFAVLLGTSMERYDSKKVKGTALNLRAEDDHKAWIDFTNSASPGDQHSEGGATEHRMASVFGRLNYNYDERYMLELTLRRDGLTMPKFTSQILLLFSKVLHILENLLLKNFTGLKVVS